MKKSFLVWLLVAILMGCTKKNETKEHLQIPEGMSIRAQFTTHLTYDNLPSDDITYLPSSLEAITIYSTFEGITPGSHFYQYIVHNAAGQHACPQDGVFNFTSEGGSQNVWSRINVATCLATPGDYVVKVYLDGNWVLEKKIKVLSEEEIKSGKYEAYWNKDKYMEVLPASNSKLKGEWLVKTLGQFSAHISNLFVVPHKGYNRIFFVEHESSDNIYIKEYQLYGSDLVFTYPRGERDEPKNLRYNVEGDTLYFYTNVIKGAFNLNSGDTYSDESLPFTPATDNRFSAPSGKHMLTKNALLDGTLLITATQYCTEPTILWASWNVEESRVYYWNECDEGDAYGFFAQEVSKPEPQRLMEEFKGITYPMYVANSGSDFIFFIERTEGKPNLIKVATQVSYYSELGFGPNFYWDGAFHLPLTKEDMGGAYMQMDFFSSPEDYLSYHYAEEMSDQFGKITKIGRIRQGALAGKEMYRMIDEGSWYEDKGAGEAYPTKPYYYLVRNEEELIVISHTEEQQSDFKIPDLDGKRKKSDLFKGVTKATQYTNQFITGLQAVPKMELPNTTTTLKRVGIVESTGDKNAYRKLTTHSIEGDIHVRQKDDGSFWRFNGDGTATLYQYQYDFSVTNNEGIELNLEEYAPYTNRGCVGSPLDFAHILTPDPSMLKEIGKTSANDAVFGFADDQDEVLQQEYAALKEAYDQAGQSFKSFKKFMENVPLFLWKDPFGRYVRFIRTEYLAPANCEPILYLYPETTVEVTVDLDEKINVIASNPALTDTWKVRAEHTGKLHDLSSNRTYDHIFWEGISGFLPPLEKGFVVDTAALENFFDEKLQHLGLTTKEAADFKEAWLKEFTETPYYFIGFYESSVIERYAPIRISPAPNTVIRILMDYKAMHAFSEVEEPTLPATPSRKGFTVVEWGGLKRK